jgi:hypothetical protein
MYVIDTLKIKMSTATAAGFEPTKEFPRGLHDQFQVRRLNHSARQPLRLCIGGRREDSKWGRAISNSAAEVVRVRVEVVTSLICTASAYKVTAKVPSAYSLPGTLMTSLPSFTILLQLTYICD